MNWLAVALFVAQITLPHLPQIPQLPSIPHVPSGIPLPPLTKAPPDSIVVQPAQKLRQVPELDRFMPIRFASLADLPHAADGTVTLAPGAFELIDQSFCLRAGGHGPTSASAYGVGALSGSRASYVSSVLERWHAQPAIAQSDVQSLLWAITSQAKISTLGDHLQSVARLLLTPQEIDGLDGGALGSIAGFLQQSGLTLPAPVRDVLDTESRMRDLLTHGNASYQQLAALAVPATAAGSDTGRERWSYDPRGFFVRYLPQSYSTTTIQLYVPPAYTIARDGNGRIVRIADDRGSKLEIAYLSATTIDLTLSATSAFADFGRVAERVSLGRTTLASSSLPSADTKLRSIDAIAQSAEPLVVALKAPLLDTNDAVAFVRGAVPATLCASLGGCSATRVASLSLVALGTPTAAFNPSSAMGTPNDAALQPLAQSGRPAPADKNKDCAKVREQRDFAVSYRHRYEDPALIAKAKANDWSGQQFQDAVHDKAVSEAGGTPGGEGTASFHQGGFTDLQACRAFYPTPEEVAAQGLPPIMYQAIMVHEEAHVVRCLEARKDGTYDDWLWRQQTELDGYDREIAVLNAWIAANC